MRVNLWTLLLGGLLLLGPAAAASAQTLNSVLQNDPSLAGDADPQGPTDEPVQFAGTGDGIDVTRKAFLGMYPDLDEAVHNGSMRAEDILIGTADLNSDGANEVVIYVDTGSCEQGCPLQVFAQNGEALSPLSDQQKAFRPVVVSATYTGGYRNLLVADDDGNPVTWVYNPDKNQYAPQPAAE